MKIQDYLLNKAGGRYALHSVFLLTLFESIFLFIPPEVFIAPPIISNKKNAKRVVLAASLGSMLGGIIAYLIGMWLYKTLGSWIIGTFSSPESFEHARLMFARHGLFIIFLAAFTPVPYKLLAICAGLLNFDPILFIGITTVFRTLRFAAFGWLVWRFQEHANAIARKYFWPLTVLAVLVAGFGVFLLYLL